MTLARLISHPGRAAGRRRSAAHPRNTIGSIRTLVAPSTVAAVSAAHGTNPTWSCLPNPRRLASVAQSAAPRSTHYRFTPSSFLCSKTASAFLPASPAALTAPSFPQAVRWFSGSAPASTMAATKIDGTAVAKKIREKLRAEIAQIKEINPRFRPSLKIIQGLCSRSGQTLLAPVG